MKNFFSVNFLVALFFFACYAMLPTSFAQAQARLKVIHNAPDAPAVDVYANEDVLLEDFEFRYASGFLSVPSGVDIEVSITPAGQPRTSRVYAQTFRFEAGQTYIAVASGLLSATGAENPLRFDVRPFAGGRDAATSTANTDILVFHGSTDAPTIDVTTAGGAATLVDDLSFGEFSDAYLEVPTADLNLEVRTADGSTVVKTYSAPLATLELQGSAITVLASGYLEPTRNQIAAGRSFGLFVDTEQGGPLVPLPEVVANPTARIKVIHNAPDAGTVDIYVNGDRLFDDFEYRTTTGFVDAPARTPLTIQVAPGNSTSAEQQVFTITTTLEHDRRYIIVANGLLETEDDTRDFNLEIYEPAREASGSENNTDLIVFHGSTDAPVVDVTLPDGTTLVNDLVYSEFSDYLSIPTRDLIVQVRTADGETVVKAYRAPLSTLELVGDALTIVASGYLNQPGDQAFGLFVATTEAGDLIALQEVTTARAQIIHNAPDAGTVDVYAGEAILVDNFEFRTATEFIDLPAGGDVVVRIAPGNSTGVADSIYTATLTPNPGATYIIVASGLLNTSEDDRAFALAVYGGGREMANNASNTDLLIFHGSPDAPTVDITAQGGSPVLADDLEFREFAGYVELPTTDVNVEVRTANGETVVAAYSAPLATANLQGSAITVLASGFLTPEGDQPAFGLFVATAAGGPLLELGPASATSVRQARRAELDMTVYPNPVSDVARVQYSLATPESVVFNVYDLQGRVVATYNRGNQGVGSYEFEQPVSGLKQGVYMIRMQTGSTSKTQKFVVR
jgi:hypothetical protein